VRPRIDYERRFAEWYDRLTLFRAVRTVLIVAIVLVLLAGLLERIVEPDTFTSLGLSYWWAVMTVTTVGYGDIVPVSPVGRVVASLLMLTGIALIPTVTSVIVATLVSKRSRIQQDALDAQGREHAETLARIEKRLDQIGGSDKAEG
jgi:voltage-gated potassium channel Kch